jgi:hypothetical protein
VLFLNPLKLGHRHTPAMPTTIHDHLFPTDDPAGDPLCFFRVRVSAHHNQP